MNYIEFNEIGVRPLHLTFTKKNHEELIVLLNSYMRENSIFSVNAACYQILGKFLKQWKEMKDTMGK